MSAPRSILLAFWRPSLNYPYNTSRLKMQDTGFVPARQQARPKHGAGFTGEAKDGSGLGAFSVLIPSFFFVGNLCFGWGPLPTNL